MEEAAAAVVVVVVEVVVVLDAVVDAAEEALLNQPQEVLVLPQVDLLNKLQEVVDAVLDVVVPGLEVLLVLVPVLVPVLLPVLLEILNREKQNSCLKGKMITIITKRVLCMAYILIGPASSSCATNNC